MTHHKPTNQHNGAVLLLALIMLTLLSLLLASGFRASAFTASAARWMQTEQAAFRAAQYALNNALNRATLPAGPDVQLPALQPSAHLRLTLNCAFLGRRNGILRMTQAGPVAVNLGYVKLTARITASDGVRHEQQTIIAVVLPASYVDGDPLPLASDATQPNQPGAVTRIAWRNPQELS